MSRTSFDVFVKDLLETAKSTGNITMFDKIGSYQFPRYYYSGSWNRLMTAKGVYTSDSYTPKGKVPFSATSLYSVTRVVRLAEFLQDLQYAAIKGARLSKIINFTDKVKPMYTQVNAKLDTSPIAVTGFSVDPRAITGAIGNRIQLTWEVTPANATDKTVTFKSADGVIARVDEKGLVTLLAVGKTRITGTAGNFSASVDITIS